MKQKLLWLKDGIDVGAHRKKCVQTYVGEKPKYLWVLFNEEDENKKPKLPIIPKHGVNAFLESQLHDYQIINGTLVYSGCTDGGVWLLLEFDE